MKRLTQLYAFALMAMLSLTFTSCDEDDEIAYTLEGTWRGNMYISYSYGGYDYQSTYSEICFLRDPYKYSSGSGYWVDHYNHAPWGGYVANHIEWRVDNGVIRVWFREEGSYIEIHDYSLSDRYFSGTIYDGDNFVEFRLTHISSPNWNDYEWGIDYWYGARQHAPAKVKGTDDDNCKPVRKVVKN